VLSFDTLRELVRVERVEAARERPGSAGIGDEDNIIDFLEEGGSGGEVPDRRMDIVEGSSVVEEAALEPLPPVNGFPARLVGGGGGGAF
jgi:DMSO/TMAO reductase YedYZ molybdopterin-dependent catalytic subunit